MHYCTRARGREPIKHEAQPSALFARDHAPSAIFSEGSATAEKSVRDFEFTERFQDFSKDFRFQPIQQKISDFSEDFKISAKISDFSEDFRFREDFCRDFKISRDFW